MFSTSVLTGTKECSYQDISSTDRRNKHNSVHLSFTGEMGLKNTFCFKSGQSSTQRYACLESLFHTIRAPNTHLHLWLIPGCCSTPWKASSAAKCFNPDLLFSADSCQLRYIIWGRSAEKEILIFFFLFSHNEVDQTSAACGKIVQIQHMAPFLTHVLVSNIYSGDKGDPWHTWLHQKQKKKHSGYSLCPITDQIQANRTQHIGLIQHTVCVGVIF